MKNIVGSLLSLFCVLLSTPVFAKEPGPRAIPVIVSLAKQQALAPTIEVPGTVISRQQANIASEVSGRLIWVAEVGDTVRKGAFIAKLDDTLQDLEVQQIEANLEREEVRVAYLGKEAKRLETMANADLTARNLLDKTFRDFGVAKTELALTKARLQFEKETLKRHKITAPFSGVVTERLARQGEWVSSGDEVLAFVNPQSLEVMARVPHETVANLTLGDKIQITQKTQSELGALRTIVPIGDVQSHLFEVRVSLKGKSWLAGQAVRVLVPIDSARLVMAVPRDAIVLRRNGASVFRIGDENKAERVSVSTGIASGAFIEIQGDVQAGDKIVTRGSERLRPGQLVKLLPSDGAES